MKILVLSDNLSKYAELCGGAKALGGEAVAFFAGAADEAAKIPAAKVYRVDVSGKMFEDSFATLKGVVSKENPDVILVSATKRGKYMAAKLAAALKTSVMTDLGNITVEGAGVKGTQMYYGGVALRTLQSTGKAIVTVGAGSFDPAGGAAGAVEDVAFVDGGSKIVRKEVREKAGSTVNLAAAKKVVGAGRGFASKEELAIAEALAAAIGGEVGCSRPIAEGEGWMSTATYIGVSGIMLKPDVYIAIGISGQIQHMIGVNSAKTIIAINKDKNAPIFKSCDYGIVGDLKNIVPALTGLIKG